MARVSRPGANLPRVADFNSRLVLDQIRRSRGDISRVEIAQNTSLTIQTVSNQVTKLINVGLVSEGPRLIQTRGKPRTPLAVNPSAGYAIGMHVDPARLSFVLIDMQVNLVAHASVPTPDSISELVAITKQHVEEMTQEVPRHLVLGIGIATPGPIDMQRGEVISPPHLAGWDHVPLRKLVADATGMDTFIQKDSIAALTGELWSHNRSVEETTLFAYIGFGLGLAYAQRGDVNMGYSGNAGELGHLHTGAEGPVCVCGRSGCLGMITAPRTIVAQAVNHKVIPPPVDLSPSSLSTAMLQVTQAAEDGNSAAIDILASASRELAKGLVILTDLMDASNVVIGGHHAAGFWPYLESFFYDEYNQVGAARNVHGISLARADFEEWVTAVGAASFVLDNAFSPRPSLLFSPGR